MACYELRSDLRNLDVSAADDEGEETLFILPKSLRNRIEEKLFEFDRMEQLSHNYRAVLKDILK